MKTLAFLALLLAAALPAPARAQLVDLQVRDLETGQWLERHPHRGRLHVAGEPGHRYAVVLRNLGGSRVLAVLSVDGVNAISGETAGTGQSGYVLEPWQQLEVRGWRKNLSEIAQFHFTALPDSYAARTGRPHDVGVIGVAVFREAGPAPYWPPAVAREEDGRFRRDAAPGAPAAAPPPPSAAADSLHAQRGAEAEAKSRQALGTGHGERRWDAARMTRFERASATPDQVSSLYYDAADALVARGVLPRPPRHPRWHEPRAFPIGFVPDPD